MRKERGLIRLARFYKRTSRTGTIYYVAKLGSVELLLFPETEGGGFTLHLAPARVSKDKEAKDDIPF